MKHFRSRPSLYFNADATYVYVQGGGTISEWKYNEHPTPKASKYFSPLFGGETT